MGPSPPVLPGLKWERHWRPLGSLSQGCHPFKCRCLSVSPPITVTLKTALLWLLEFADLLRVAKQVRPRPFLD